MHFSWYGDPINLALSDEKITVPHSSSMSPLLYFRWLYIWAYFWIHYFVLVVSLSILAPVSHCLNYYWFQQVLILVVYVLQLFIKLSPTRRGTSWDYPLSLLPLNIVLAVLSYLIWQGGRRHKNWKGRKKTVRVPSWLSW